MIHANHCGAQITAVFHWPKTAREVRDFLFPALDSKQACKSPVGPWCALNEETGKLEFAVFPENVPAMLQYCRDYAYAFTFHSVNS